MHFFSKLYLFAFSLGIIIAIAGCQMNTKKEVKSTDVKNELSFQSYAITDSVKLMWAHCPVDITGDKITDLVFIHNNGSGGYLGYYEGKKDSGLWVKQIIAETPPDGGLFALGDLECADIDFDGDIDIVAAKHPGEWVESNAPAVLYWYENPDWEAHLIGEAPAFVKDVSIVDFNKDKKMDIAVMTFENNTLSIFQQKEADNWEKVQYYQGYGNLHEGMGTGDVNGDGWIDIVANAHIFYNPGQDLKAEWKEENLDEKWNTQTGNWSRNGTKVFLRDLDKDGKAEIFISHSERSGYPVSWYKQNENGEWEENIISDSIPACHTLQVYDFDLDGDYDVLAGINKSRAEALGFTSFEVTIFLSEDNYKSWTPLVIEENGIYNGQVADFDQDGDYDIFRYPTHDAIKYFLFKNRTID